MPPFYRTRVAEATLGLELLQRKVLCDLGVDAGLDRAGVEGFLASDEGVGEVRQEEERGRRMGIDGVPFFLIDGRVALSGAQEPDVIVGAIETAARSGDA
jgi:predicted DsbA family dithiol-disulfide isomerase